MEIKMRTVFKYLLGLSLASFITGTWAGFTLVNKTEGTLKHVMVWEAKSKTESLNESCNKSNIKEPGVLRGKTRKLANKEQIHINDSYQRMCFEFFDVTTRYTYLSTMLDNTDPDCVINIVQNPNNLSLKTEKMNCTNEVALTEEKTAP
jgi:hypothetical protein